MGVLCVPAPGVAVRRAWWSARFRSIGNSPWAAHPPVSEQALPAAWPMKITGGPPVPHLKKPSPATLSHKLGLCGRREVFCFFACAVLLESQSDLRQ